MDAAAAAAADFSKLDEDEDDEDDELLAKPSVIDVKPSVIDVKVSGREKQVKLSAKPSASSKAEGKQAPSSKIKTSSREEPATTGDVDTQTLGQTKQNMKQKETTKSPCKANAKALSKQQSNIKMDKTSEPLGKKTTK